MTSHQFYTCANGLKCASERHSRFSIYLHTWEKIKVRILIALLALSCETNYVFADAIRDCDLKTSLAVETEQATLKNWDDLYSLFTRFRECDNGGVAEGYSDFVVHHLATQWSSLPKVAALAERNQNFREFILSHIDATADTEELGNIEIHSRTKCPLHLKEFCRAIEASAKNAISESMSVIRK